MATLPIAAHAHHKEVRPVKVNQLITPTTARLASPNVASRRSLAASSEPHVATTYSTVSRTAYVTPAV